MTKGILTEDKLEVIKNALKKYSEENKPIKNFTNKEAILALRSSIESMIKLGFSYDDVSVALEKGDLKLKGATIREYLKDAKKTRATKRKTDDNKVEKNSNKIESDSTKNRTSSQLPRDDFSSL